MRITGGKAAGIEFFSPRSMKIRPVLERSRIALFASLGALDNFEVLDLYAGSGAFGLEAASRGASKVTFVDNDFTTAKTISENVSKLLNAGLVFFCSVAKYDVKKFFKVYLGLSPNLIFIDPPYKSLNTSLKMLFNDDHFAKIAEHANIIVKTPEKFDVSVIQNSKFAELVKQRRFGGTDFCFVKIKNTNKKEQKENN